MKRNLTRSLLATAFLFIFCSVSNISWGQTTAFVDAFGRSSLTTSAPTTYSVSGSGTQAIAASFSSSQGNSLQLKGAASTTGNEYVSGLISSFSSFNSVLSSNSGLVTWTVNVNTTRSSTLSGISTSGASSYGQAVILAGTSGTFSSGNGYALVYGPSGSRNYELISYNGGIATTKTVIINSGTNDFSGATNYVSLKVTYNPSGNLWSLYVRDDGSSDWTDAGTGTFTQIGSATANTDYTSSTMVAFGFFCNHSNPASPPTFNFDNFKVTVPTVATNYYWNGSNTSALSGNWNASSNYFSTPTATTTLAPWVDGSSNIANFQTTNGGTVTLVANRTFNQANISGTNFIFSTANGGGSGYQLNGPIVLAASAALQMPVDNSLTNDATLDLLGNLSGGSSSALNIRCNTTTAGSSSRINLAANNVAVSVPTVNITGSSTSQAGFVATATGTAVSSNIVNNSSAATMIGATGSNDITVTGNMSGSGSVLFAAGQNGGNGNITLTPSTSNTYNGTTYFNGGTGTVKLGNVNGLSSSSDIVMGANSTFGQTLDLNGYSPTFQSLASNGGTGNITNNSTTANSTLTVNQTSTKTFGLVISDGSNKTTAVTKSGSGSLTLSAVNTYTGGTSVSGGTLVVSGNTSASGAYTVSNATLNITGTPTVPASFNLNSNGILLIPGHANTGTNPTSFTAGYLTMNGGTIQCNGSGIDFSNSSAKYKGITLSSGGGTMDANGANTITLQPTISGTGGLTLTNTGAAGGIVLVNQGSNNGTANTSAHTYSGGTTINGNTNGITVRVGGANAFPTTTALNLSTSNATLDLTNSGAGNYSTQVGSLTGSGNITLGSATLTVSGTSSTSYSGVMSGTGGLTKAGSSTLTLSNSNTYSGATSINGGAISVSADNNLGTAPGSATAGNIVLGGGTLSASAGFTLNSNRGIALTASTSSAIDVATSQTLVYGGIISGGASGNLSKTSAGTLTFSGTNTYPATTTVSAGTLNLTGSLASATTINSGATLSGTGSTSGTCSISGTISPATSGTIGTLSTGNFSMANGSAYTLDITDVGTLNTNCDKIAATGTFTIAPTTTINATFSGNGISNFVPNATYSWVIGTYTSGTPSIGTVNVNVSGITPQGQFTVSASGGNIVLTYTPTTLTISSQTATATNLTQNSTNNNIYTLIGTASGATVTVNAVTFTGIYTAADLTNFKLYYNTTGTFGTTTQLGSTITSIPASGNTITFSGLSQSIAVGTPSYFYLTADIPCAATGGNTLQINAVATTDVGTTSAVAGTTSAGSSLSVVTTTPNNVGSVTPTAGNNQVSVAFATPSGCYSEVMIVATSTNANNNGTPTGNGNSYTASLTYGSGTAFGNGFVVYKGSTSPQVVTGLTNGTLYYFKVFTRNGTSWSSGVESSATPALIPTTIYSQGFETGTLSSPNYSGGASMDANLSSSNWSVASTAVLFTGSGGSGTNALGVNPSATNASPYTLTFNVASGYQLSVTAYNYWRQTSTNGASVTSITINGTTITTGSVTCPTAGANIGSTSVANTISGLTGTITVLVNISGSGSFRLDDFTLIGNVTTVPNYYLATNSDPTIAANWSTNTNGIGGTQPTSMSVAGNWYVTQNSNTPTTAWANSWTPSGTVYIAASSTFNIAGTMDLSSSTQIVALGSSATINATANGYIKTSNSNGFYGSTSTSISNSNSPTISLNTASTVEYNSISTQSVTTSVTYGNVKFTGSGGTYNISSALGTSGSPYVFANGTLSLLAGTLYLSTAAANTSYISVGNVSITGGTLDNLSTASGTSCYLYISGNWSQSAGIVQFSGSGYGKIIFSGGASSTYSGLTSSSSFTYWLMQVTNSTTLTLNSNVALNGFTNGTNVFTLDLSSTLIDGGYTILANNSSGTTSGNAFVISGNYKASNKNGFSGTVSTTISTSSTSLQLSSSTYNLISLGSSSTVEYAATTGTQTVSARSDYNNMTLSGGSAKTLGGASTVSGVLTLTNGILTTTSTNLLTMTNTANTAISGGSTTSFINGPITWTLGTASSGTYIVPVGGNSTYYPMAFTAGTISSGSPTINVQAFASAPTGTADGSTIAAVGTEYWKVITTGSTFSASSFSLAKTISLGSMNVIAKSITNGALSFSSFGGSSGTVSSTTGLVNSSSGLNGASTLYLCFGQTFQTYYLKSGGATNNLTDWFSNSNGTGSNPTSFTGIGIYWNVINNTSVTNAAAWALGSNSKIIVGDGTNATAFTIPSSAAITGTMDVLNNGNLIIQSSTTPTLGTISTGSTVTYDGTLAQTITATTYHNLVISGNRGTNAITLPSRQITVNNTFDPSTFSSTATTPVVVNTDTFNFSSASSQTVPAFYYGRLNLGTGPRTWASSGIIDINQGFTPTSGTNTITGSTIRYSSTLSGWILSSFTTNFSGYQYYNLIFSGSGSWSMNNLALKVKNDLTVSAGTLILNGSSSNSNAVFIVDGKVTLSGGTILTNSNTTYSSTFNIGGDFTLNGGTLTRSAGAAAASLVFNSPSSIQSYSQTSGTISGTMSINVGTGSTTNTLKLSTNMTLGSATSNNITVNVLNGSAIDFGTNILTQNSTGGIFNLQSGANLYSGNANGIVASIPNSGSVQVSNITYSTGANYIFNGSVNQITGTGLPATVNNLTINNSASSGIVSLTVSTSPNNLFLNGGFFKIPSSVNLNIPTSVAISSNGGDFESSSTGNVNFAGSNLVSGTVNFYPTININGTVDFGSASAIYSTMKMNNGGSIINNPPVYITGSTLQYNASANRGLEWSATINQGYPYHVQISNNSTFNVSGGTPSTARQCGGDVTIDNGSTFTMNSTADQMTAPVTIKGNVNINGTLELSGVSSGDLVVNGNWTRANGATFTQHQRKVTFNGATPQTITAAGATAETFGSIEINNTSSLTAANNGVLMAAGTNLIINDSIILTHGKLNVGSGELQIQNTNTNAIKGHQAISGNPNSSPSFVVGAIRRKISTSATDYDFPLGTDAGNYEVAKIIVNSNSNVDNLKATFNQFSNSGCSYSANLPNFAAPPPSNGGNHNSAITDMLNYGYYQVEPYDISNALMTSYSINYDAQMTFNGHTNGLVGSNATGAVGYTLMKQPSCGNAWGMYGGTYNNTMQLASNSPTLNTPVTLKLFGLQGFSIFGGGFSPDEVLPIELVDFTAQQLGNDASLNWTTASEKDNDKFDIERSTDGIAFEKVGSVQSRGNMANNYNFTDANITNLNSDIIYYRLRQVDMSGTFNYSPVRSITINADANGFTVNSFYPNPFSNSVQLQLSAGQAATAHYQLFDTKGTMVLQADAHFNKGNNVLTIDGLSQLANGIYLLKINSGNQSYTTTLQKQ